MSNLLDHKYTREVYIKGYKKTNLHFLILSELQQTDDYYKILASKIDNIAYKFPESSRLIIFNTCETWNAVIQLETFYNLSTVRILYTDNFLSTAEIIHQVKSYLVDTILELEVNSIIANAVKFRIYLYLSNFSNELVNFKKVRDSTHINILGVNLAESLIEYLYELNFNENMNLIEDYYQYNFIKEETKNQGSEKKDFLKVNSVVDPSPLSVSYPSLPVNPSPFYQTNNSAYNQTIGGSTSSGILNRIFPAM